MTETIAPTAEAQAPAADTVASDARTDKTPATEADPKPDKAEKAEPSLDDDLRKVWKRSKGRDETGKFASKKDDEPAQRDIEDAIKHMGKDAGNTKPAKAETSEKPEEAEAEPSEPAKPAVTPPRSWKKEYQEKFASLPVEVQSYVAQRETEASQAISKLGQTVKQYEPLGHTINEFSDYIQAVGKPAPQLMRELLTASRALDIDPAGTIRQLAQVYGVDLDSLADPNAPQHDARASALELENRELKARLHNQQWNEEQAKKTQHESKVSELQKIGDDFIAANPEVNEVMDDFVSLVGLIRQQNPTADPRQILQDAKDRAIWANPTTRTKLIQKQAQEAEQARIEEAKKRANEARAASSINVQGTQRIAAPGDLDSDLRAIWRKRAS